MIGADMARAILLELKNVANDSQRFAQTLIAFTENKITKDEFSELCTEIFQEDGSIEKSSKSFLKNIIEHLPLLKYGIDTTARKHLTHEIRGYQKSLAKNLAWWHGPRRTTIINDLIDLLPLIYLQGIRTYKRHDRKNPNLKQIMNSLPEQCPWTLDELVEGEPEDLILRLPEL